MKGGDEVQFSHKTSLDPIHIQMHTVHMIPDSGDLQLNHVAVEC